MDTRGYTFSLSLILNKNIKNSIFLFLFFIGYIIVFTSFFFSLLQKFGGQIKYAYICLLKAFTITENFFSFLVNSSDQPTPVLQTEIFSVDSTECDRYLLISEVLQIKRIKI